MSLVLTEETKQKLLDGMGLPREFILADDHINVASEIWCFDVEKASIYAISSNEMTELKESGGKYIFLELDIPMELPKAVSSDFFIIAS